MEEHERSYRQKVMDSNIAYIEEYFKDRCVCVAQLIRHLAENGVPILSLNLSDMIQALEDEYRVIEKWQRIGRDKYVK